jgi:hypothetical protein
MAEEKEKKHKDKMVPLASNTCPIDFDFDKKEEEEESE